MKKIAKGLLVAIEGIDGAGKTTQAKLLRERLEKEEYHIVSFKEPTRGEWGLKIRNLAINGRKLHPRDELELFIRDREEDVKNNILPSLRENKIVIMDRYYYSNIAYQGAMNIDVAHIKQINEKFAPIPDLVVILDVAPRIGLSRIRKLRDEKPNYFERLGYLKKVREIFNNMENEPNVQIIDGSAPIERVHEQIYNIVKDMIKPLEEELVFERNTQNIGYRKIGKSRYELSSIARTP